MTMLSLERCRQIAAGTPDPSSGEFRSAVAAVSAWLKNAIDPANRMFLEDLRSSLLAHGEPVQPRKPTREELSAIRREASARGLVARARASLERKIDRSRTGLVGVADLKPAVFDAALEMIEDGEAHCVQCSEGVEATGTVRRISIAATIRPLPQYVAIRDCPWKSRRRQKEERI